MLRHYLAPLTAFAALALPAVPASATVEVCGTVSCATHDDKVLVNVISNSTSVTGTTNLTGVGVTFTSTTDHLNGEGGDKVSSVDGILNDVTMTIDPGYWFTAAEFSFDQLPGSISESQATSLIVSYFAPGLLGPQTQTIDFNGLSTVGLYGTAGEHFISVGFTADPIDTGFKDIKQIYLSGVSAVPEPATWALMIFGFLAVGASMRRRKTVKPSYA